MCSQLDLERVDALKIRQFCIFSIAVVRVVSLEGTSIVHASLPSASVGASIPHGNPRGSRWELWDGKLQISTRSEEVDMTLLPTERQTETEGELEEQTVQRSDAHVRL